MDINFNDWDNYDNTDIIINNINILKYNESLKIKVNKKCEDKFFHILNSLKIKTFSNFISYKRWFNINDNNNDFIITILKSSLYLYLGYDNFNINKHIDIDLCE